MASMRIVTDILSDAAIMSDSSGVFGFSPKNVQRNERSLVWRGQQGGSSIKGIFDTARLVSCVAVLGHNLGAADKIQIVLKAPDGSWAHYMPPTPAFEPIAAGFFRAGLDSWGGDFSAAQAGVPSSYVLWLPVALAATEFQVAVQKLQGEAEIVRVVVGEYFEPSVNFSYEPLFSWKEDVTEKTSMSGHSVAVGSARPVRQADVVLDHLGISDRARLAGGLSRTGKGGSLFVALYPGHADAALDLLTRFVCRRQNDLAQRETYFQNHQLKLSFIEA